MDLKMHFRFLVIWFLFVDAVTAMFGKRLGPDPELSSGSAAKKLKANIADLFLSNDISAKRAQTFFQQAAAAGLHEMHSLGKTGSQKNVHRNLLKKLLKGNKWPDLYYAPVLECTRTKGGNLHVAFFASSRVDPRHPSAFH